MNRFKLCVPLAGALAIGMLSPVGPARGVGGNSGLDTDVVATGYLPDVFDLDDVEVELVPTITPRTPKGPLPSYYLDPEQMTLSADRLLTIELAPADVPAAFRTRDGMVNLLVAASDGVVVWSTMLTSQVIETSGRSRRWVDPADLHEIARPDSVIGARRLAALPPPTFASPSDPAHGEDDSVGWDEGAAEPRVVPGCPDGGSGPHETEHLDTVRAWATIGTSYPVGDSTAFMDVSSNESNGAKYGGAVKYAGIGASASGNAWAGGGWQATWPARGEARSYRAEIEYARVKYSRYLAGPACDHVHWVAIRETGGVAANRRGVTRPSWHTYDNCAEVRGPVDWGRTLERGSNYEYGAAVKLQDALGIDLGISRSYSRSQAIWYHVAGRQHWMCGNDNTPSLAGKVEEWRTAPPDAP